MSALSRRTFLAAAAGLTAAATVRAQENAYPEGKYVDIHTHIGEGWGLRPGLTADMLLAWMDQHDIAQAVVLPLVSPESWDHPITSGFVLRETEAHRDRLIPFCCIDPRQTNLGEFKNIVGLLQRYKDAGVRGFGEYKPGVAMDDPRSMDLFRACAEVGLPILFHLDRQRNVDDPGLPKLSAVLDAIPDGTFIGHATGFWSSISGDATERGLAGYPEGKVTPGGALDVLFDRHPNIYGDLSAGSGANALMRDLEFGREFVIRRADRLLFGTDYLGPGQQVPQLSLFDAMELPEDVQAKVYRDNARTLLGL